MKLKNVYDLSYLQQYKSTTSVVPNFLPTQTKTILFLQYFIEIQVFNLLTNKNLKFTLIN